MPITKRIRHYFTKQPIIDIPLTWLQHRDLHHADHYVAAYPRSGSTWLRFMLCELLTGAETSFSLVDEILADVGHHGKAPRLLLTGGRLLKTHEPYRTQYRRAIYLVRDVRDVVISEYIFMRRLCFFSGDFAHFFELFLQGKVHRYGSWVNHALSWLNFADQQPDQALIIHFENLQQDTAGVVNQCLDFLQVARSREQIEQATHNHNLAHMKQKEDRAKKFSHNAHGLRFITDGAVGKGKQELSPQQMERLMKVAQPVLVRLGYVEQGKDEQAVQSL